MRITIQHNFNNRKWLHRLFSFLPCKHEVVSVEENFKSRYGTHTIYTYCLNCGRKLMDIERNCEHEINTFGECNLCLSRIFYPCKENHEWVNEPDTDEYYCKNCGEWTSDFHWCFMRAKSLSRLGRPLTTKPKHKTSAGVWKGKQVWRNPKAKLEAPTND